MVKRAFIFPGQGSQYVGMAKDLFDNSVKAKEMILMADEAIGLKLSNIMFNGPEESLKQTEVTQPAIFLHSVVLASLLRNFDTDMVAGHSLGEYSALVVAGAIQFSDAVRLVRARGAAMQRAGVQFPGTMAAIVGLQADKLVELCRAASETGIVQCANFNSPGQIVISGSVEGVRKAMELCKQNGAKLVKELVVSGAFHSPLMKPAIDEFKTNLDSTNIYNAKIPVYANVTAKPVTDKDEIKDLLIKQLDSPVRWEETIVSMIADGVEEFVEIGPGKVLQGLVKRINPNIPCIGIEKYSDLEKYL
ncbi:MAG: ACP S-malonyltransferase [Ignavibacteria bacterium]